MSEERSPPTSARASGVASPRERRILVIEDNVDAADTLREILEMEGHAVGVAYSGAEGVSKARAFVPDVILCDIGLPDMDGHAVARELRAEPSLAGALFVALSGFTRPQDIARALEAGFDRHLAKPPDLAALERLLAG
jgi:two-component system, chemotaxis family, CheB/CheR fusion protein